LHIKGTVRLAKTEQFRERVFSQAPTMLVGPLLPDTVDIYIEYAEAHDRDRRASDNGAM
jgi:hypothetical protein